MPFPNTATLERARIAAWMVLLGSIAGTAFLDGYGAILPLVAMLDVIVLIVLNSWIRTRRNTAPPPAKATSERSLIFVVIVTLTWGMIDAFFLGQGVIAIVLCVAGVLYFLPRAIAARHDGAQFKLRLSKAAITSVAGFAALGIIVYGNVIARDRAETLIVAVDQFYLKHGRYPARLEEVVPEFISEIPAAKYVGLADKFRYSVSGSHHSLQYTVVPPFGRSIYTFEDRKWTSLD